jgi:sorting nexin-3/12
LISYLTPLLISFLKHIVNMLNAIQSTGPTLQIEVTSPEILGEGSKRYVDYTVKVQTTLPIFERSESVVHRRYSQFEWLHKELEQSNMKIVVPSLPDKAWQRQLPFRKKSNLFEEDFIEERRQGLEAFINKIASHPLAQNERALHVFLFDPEIDLTRYVRGKVK